MKTCPKCKKEFGDKNRFCDGCGTKLKEKILETAHKIEKISPILLPWIIFIALIILTSVLLLPTKVVSYQIEVPSIETEQYSIDVPYETVEPYTVQVPYEVKEQYVESVPYEEQEAYQKCFIICWTEYRNVTKYKDVIKERTVTKYREETQYKTVTKTRTETREREVRKTKTEIKQKEVNWIFGFDAIIKFKNLS